MMMIPNRLIAALLLAGALAACSDAPTSAPTDAEPGDELARRVEALGFRGDMVLDFGDHVIVEGDVRIPKSHLPSVSSRPNDPLRPRFQYRTNALVGSPKVHQITVNLAGLAAEPDWENAARAALPLWSGIAGSYVRLVEAAPGAPADITFSLACIRDPQGNVLPNVAAAASWPSGGNPGSTITVNQAGCLGLAQNNQQRLHNMVHEIGHTLGFRHTNWAARNEQLDPTHSQIGAVHIWGTPGTGGDPGSVMNGGTALNAWAGFSANDRIATARLYPLPTVTGANATDFGGQVRLTWSPVVGATSYSVQRVEERTQDDFYANTVTTTVTEGTLVTGITGTTFDTGAAWTGVSSCLWSMGWQTSDMSGYWYRVTAHFPTGDSPMHTSVAASDATC
jgi:hypothetical protein